MRASHIQPLITGVNHSSTHSYVRPGFIIQWWTLLGVGARSPDMTRFDNHKMDDVISKFATGIGG